MRGGSEYLMPVFDRIPSEVDVSFGLWFTLRNMMGCAVDERGVSCWVCVREKMGPGTSSTGYLSNSHPQSWMWRRGRWYVNRLCVL